MNNVVHTNASTPMNHEMKTRSKARREELLLRAPQRPLQRHVHQYSADAPCRRLSYSECDAAAARSANNRGGDSASLFDDIDDFNEPQW